ncbi:MAG: hypothetical protein WKF57_02705 [Nakamurella sp.]
MNEQRLRELMNDSVEGVETSDSLRTTVSAAIGGTRVGRRLAVRGWIAVGGAGLAAAAVLLVAPLVRPPSSAPTGPAVEQTVSSTSGSVSVSVGPAPVDDVASVLGSETWYVVRVVSQGTALALAPGVRTEEAMRIELTGAGLQGYDGCNWIGADPAMLSSVPSATVGMSRTGKGCTTKTVGQDEFIAGLQDGPKSWTRSGQDLVLTTRDQQITFSTMPLGSSPTSSVAELDIVATLKSSTWYVSNIITDGDTLTAPAPHSLDLAMRLGIKRNSVMAYDGCGWFYIYDSVVSSAPSVTAGVSYSGTQCLPPPTGQPEFSDALLTGPKSWSMVDGDLVLTTPRYMITFTTTPPALAGPDEPADEQFSPLSLLMSRTWFVTGLTQDGRSVVLDRPASLASAMQLGIVDGKLLGFDGCFSFDFEMSVVFASPAVNSPWRQQAIGCVSPPRGQTGFAAALSAGNKSWAGSGGELILTTKHYRIAFSATPPPASATPVATR